uniref:G_PROTEIN_RECEP_F1_2 domain-containing protein n=1 Tax=Parastrongyloides trichosuri TaxID=131310 RepID=A0A0N4ZN03_PARTI
MENINIILNYNSDDINCTSYNVAYPDPSTHWISIVGFTTYYTIIFILGLIGNFYILILTIKYKTLQSVQNIFILNLSIADIFLCLTSIPVTPLVNIQKEWIFGEIGCRVSGAIQAISIFISTYSLCAISIDRYYRLIESPNTALTKVQAIIATLTIWLVSVILTFPYVYNMKLVSYDEICGFFCTEAWESNKYRQIYTIVLLFFQAVLPFCIMAICYHQIFSTLHNRANSKILSITQQVNLLSMLTSTVGNDVCINKLEVNKLIEKRKKIMSQKKKITIILVLMVLIFAVASLPLNIVSILTEIESHNIFELNDGTDLTYLINIIVHAIAMIVCITNPLLYALLNPEFRIMVMKSLNCYISAFNLGGNSMYFSNHNNENDHDFV